MNTIIILATCIFSVVLSQINILRESYVGPPVPLNKRSLGNFFVRAQPYVVPPHQLNKRQGFDIQATGTRKNGDQGGTGPQGAPGATGPAGAVQSGIGGQPPPPPAGNQENFIGNVGNY